MREQVRPTWLKAWFLAMRPRTLSVSLSPILVATALATQVTLSIDWTIVLFALLGSLCLQIGTNLINDAIDFKKGADTNDRLGPQRMTQSGFLSSCAVMRSGVVCFSLAILCAIPLIIVGGWPILVIAAISVACGYLYTGGLYPLAYVGLGELFVLFFFGWVATATLYFLLTGFWAALPLWAGTQIGLLAAVPCAINNLRDIVTDAKAGKRTLAVRWGRSFALRLIYACSLLPFLMGLLWLGQGQLLAALLPCLALPLVLSNLKRLANEEPSASYNGYLARSAQCQLLFGALLAAGLFSS